MSGNFNFGTIATNVTECRESPLLWLPGVDSYVQISVAGSGTLASPTMTLYENGIDVSSTKLTGSMSIPTGSRTIKTKSFASLVGGSNYKAYISFTDDGVPQVRELTLVVPKLGVNPSRYPLAHNTLRIAESPVLIYPGQSMTFQLVVDGQGEIGASPTMAIYKGVSDESASLLSGSLSVTGRTITLKAISGLTGGAEYLVYVYFTDGGKNTARYFEILTPKLGAY
jgi:hypothetical protein